MPVRILLLQGGVISLLCVVFGRALGAIDLPNSEPDGDDHLPDHVSHHVQRRHSPALHAASQEAPVSDTGGNFGCGRLAGRLLGALIAMTLS